MLSIDNILETNQMIHDNKLDVRTITMGISLLECASSSGKELCDRIYDRITKEAEHLVSTGEDIEREFGIPIINKRISVTPISLVAGGSDLTSYVPIAEAMNRAAKTVGVNFIGGFSALVTKGATRADRILIDSIPEALATTDIVCSSVGVGSTKTGINMDAVRDMGIIVKKTAELTKDNDALGCAKLVIFCNPVEDNPFMAGGSFCVNERGSALFLGGFVAGVCKKPQVFFKG